MPASLVDGAAITVNYATLLEIWDSDDDEHIEKECKSCLSSFICYIFTVFRLMLISVCACAIVGFCVCCLAYLWFGIVCVNDGESVVF